MIDLNGVTARILREAGIGRGGNIESKEIKIATYEYVPIYRSKRDVGQDEAYSEGIRSVYPSTQDWGNKTIESGVTFTAKDLIIDDKATEADFLNINPLFGARSVRNKWLGYPPERPYMDYPAAEILESDFKGLRDYAVAGGGKMMSCFDDMADRFIRGDGGYYRDHPALFERINEDSRTNDFFEDLTNLLCIQLSTPKINGNLNYLKFNPLTRKILADRDSEETRRIFKDEFGSDMRRFLEKHTLYEACYLRNAFLRFDGRWGKLGDGKGIMGNLGDNLNGLGIIIHDVWSIYASATVTVTYYEEDPQINGRCFVTLFDNFGLDIDDVRLDSDETVDPAKQDGFLAWYILQHHTKRDPSKYRPFINVINLYRDFGGSFSKYRKDELVKRYAEER